MKTLLTSLSIFALLCASAEAGGTVGRVNPSPKAEAPARGVAVKAPPRLSAPAANRVRLDTAPLTDGGWTRSLRQRAYGSFAVPYTATRVQAGKSAVTSEDGGNYLATTYPYRAVGRILFSFGGGRYSCSGTVIRRGIVLTAAHCIQGFGWGQSTFTDWTFTPANFSVSWVSERQAAPYGVWAWSAVEAPATWADGTDIGIGSARDNDLALIAIAPRADGKLVGDVVGKIDYAAGNYSFVQMPAANNLAIAAVTTLGYPGLLDDGDRMQRVDGPAYLTKVGAALQIASGGDLTGGSSGGPWIVNFHAKRPNRSGGSVLGRNTGMRVIGVTSWGAIDPNSPKDNYASRLGVNPAFPNTAYGSYGPGNIGALMQALCARKPAGSTKTYAALGYCR